MTTKKPAVEPSEADTFSMTARFQIQVVSISDGSVTVRAAGRDYVVIEGDVLNLTLECP